MIMISPGVTMSLPEISKMAVALQISGSLLKCSGCFRLQKIEQKASWIIYLFVHPGNCDLNDSICSWIVLPIATKCKKQKQQF